MPSRHELVVDDVLVQGNVPPGDETVDAAHNAAQEATDYDCDVETVDAAHYAAQEPTDTGARSSNDEWAPTAPTDTGARSSVWQGCPLWISEALIAARHYSFSLAAVAAERQTEQWRLNETAVAAEREQRDAMLAILDEPQPMLAILDDRRDELHESMAARVAQMIEEGRDVWELIDVSN